MTVDLGDEGTHAPRPDPRLTPVILLEVANLASGVGNAIVMLAIPWLVLEKTGSAASAGLVAAVSAITALLVAPFVGWLVDRFGRRPVSVISDILSAFAVAGIPLMAMIGDLTIPRSWRSPCWARPSIPPATRPVGPSCPTPPRPPTDPWTR